MKWIKSGIDNPSKSEVIGRIVAGMKKRMTMQNRQKSNAKKNIKKTKLIYILWASTAKKGSPLLLF